MAEDSDEWEICNDNGFVYKRRRLTDAADQPSASPSNEVSEAELRRRRRSRRRSCLIRLRDKYKRELEHWEQLSGEVIQLSEQVPLRNCTDLVINGNRVGSVRDLEDLSRFQSIDELLAQVESQEAILSTIESICDHIDALCKDKEEKIATSLMDLPIWASPRTVLKSLST